MRPVVRQAQEAAGALLTRGRRRCRPRRATSVGADAPVDARLAPLTALRGPFVTPELVGPVMGALVRGGSTAGRKRQTGAALRTILRNGGKSFIWNALRRRQSWKLYPRLRIFDLNLHYYFCVRFFLLISKEMTKSQADMMSTNKHHVFPSYFQANIPCDKLHDS